MEPILTDYGLESDISVKTMCKQSVNENHV